MIDFKKWIGKDKNGKDVTLPRDWVLLEGSSVGWVDLQPGHPVTCQYGLYDHERVEITEAIEKRFGEKPSQIREPPVITEPIQDPDDEPEETESSLILPEDFLS